MPFCCLFIIFPQSRALLNAHEGATEKITCLVGNDGRTETQTLA
jgi:hypothetical protein